MRVGLVEGAVGRLQRALGWTGTLGAIHAEHHERAVFEIIGPAGPAIVKVDSSPQRHVKERAALAVAADAGLPVPAVVYADAEGPAILALEHLQGEPLGAGSAQAWRHAGQLLRLLHEQNPPSDVATVSSSGRSWNEHFSWWSDQEVHRLSERQALPPDSLREVHKRLADAFGVTAEPDLRLLHGDCQADHFLVDVRRARVTGVIDFGDAVRGDPVWDLAVLTLAHQQHLPDVLSGYAPDRVLRERVERLLLSYWMIRRLGSASWMHEHGYDDLPDLNAAQALLPLLVERTKSA